MQVRRSPTCAPKSKPIPSSAGSRGRAGRRPSPSDLDGVVEREVGGVPAPDAPVHLRRLGDRDLDTVRRDAGSGFNSGKELADEPSLRPVAPALKHRDLDDRVVGAPVLRVDEIGGVETMTAEPLLWRLVEGLHDRAMDRIGEGSTMCIERRTKAEDDYLCHDPMLTSAGRPVSRSFNGRACSKPPGEDPRWFWSRLRLRSRDAYV